MRRCLCEGVSLRNIEAKELSESLLQCVTYDASRSEFQRVLP